MEQAISRALLPDTPAMTRVPAGHRMHASASSEAEYVPTSQNRHTSPRCLAPTTPGMTTVPGGHGLHWPRAATFANRPEGQAEQDLAPVGPVGVMLWLPSAHGIALEFLVGHWKPRGHSLHLALNGSNSWPGMHVNCSRRATHVHSSRSER